MDYLNSIFITILLTMVLTACSPEAGQPDVASNEPTVTAGMLQHTVYFYLNEGVTAEQKEHFEEGLKELLSIEEVYDYQIGVPGKTDEREVTDHSFGYSFISWFENIDDYRVYAEHPTHLEFIDEYKGIWADVKVYDSEIIAIP